MAAPANIARENGKKGGRPKGAKSLATLEKEKVLEAVRQRIMGNAHNIINGQLSLAQGQQFLYRIDTTTDAKGNKVRSKPILVTDPDEIAAYLDGEYGDGDSMDNEENYFYITTKEPENQAIEALMNRTFGKPVETVELQGGISLKIDV